MADKFAQSEYLYKMLQVYVPEDKLMEFYLLLLAWAGAIVFAILALTQVSKISSSGTTFTDAQEKAVQNTASYAGISLLCIVLVQFLTLRVTLACDAC
jgi:hypothetical protein